MAPYDATVVMLTRREGFRMKRMSILLAALVALVMVAGCAPRYAYHSDHHHGYRVKGYYLADGTYVKAHPGQARGHYKVQKVIVKKKKK